ncbi:MAG: hypothetical protein JNM76_16520 [Betaproteobacteria bacterium]|nr:hypothetical protein [Betaproteobacteria bacterium]
MMKSTTFQIVVGVMATIFPALSALAADERLSDFEFTPTSRPPLKVYMALPAKVAADTPIVFALHGMTRSARAVRDAWAPAALVRNVIVVTPHFDAKAYPKSEQYNLGNTRDAAGKPLPAKEWTYTVIEELFDAVKTRTGSAVGEYSLYGHSAGAQFAHRLLLMLPAARVKRVISANAGYYVMPDDSPAPFGMAASGVGAAQACRAYGVPMTLLIGNDDDDPKHHQLNNTANAKAQGPHRLARGWQFFLATKQDAAAKKCVYRWTVETVPGAGHDFDKMAVAAAARLP